MPADESGSAAAARARPAATAASAPTHEDPPSGSPVGSVDKALRLLQVLAPAGPEGMLLREIAEASGLNKASAHRLLRALAHRDFARQGPHDQRYRLGGSPLTLADSFTKAGNLPVLFAPALAAIALRAQELVHLGRLEGTQVVYLDKVEPERTLRVWSQVGKRAPAARTALGRALLAAQGVDGAFLAPYAEASARPSTADAHGRPDQAPAHMAAAVPLPRLQDAVDQARRCGWSTECEENEPGIACVGVALTRPEGHSAAISITGPIARMDTQRLRDLGRLLREELSRFAPAGFTVMAPVG